MERTQLNTTELGSTSMVITRVGFGAWAIGGAHYDWGWGGQDDDEPGAVAVAWTLANPAVDGAITGFRRPDQVDPILDAASLELDGDDIAAIEGRS